MKVLDVRVLMRGPHSSDSVFVWRVALLIAKQMLVPCLAALSGMESQVDSQSRVLVRVLSI